MAVYSKLLYRDGGGILLSQRKEEQANNKATILIGLGGTGVLERLKRRYTHA